MILRIRDADGNIQEIIAIKGDNYVLTEADKQEIAAIVAGTMPVSDNGYLNEEQVMALIQANMPPSGDGDSY